MRKRILAGDSPLEFPNLHYTRSTDESKWLNTEAKGSIIISANGMCTAGRIKHHLKYNLFRPESSIVFVGYQAEGTLGRRLIEGAKQVKVYGTDVSVKAQIHTLGGFSAHADQDGLFAWVKNIKNPKLKVFVVHGEEQSAKTFAEKLHAELGVTTHVPDWGESIDPATMKSEVASYTTMEANPGLDTEIEKLSQSFKILMDKYNKAKITKKAGEMRKIQEDIHDARALMKMIIDEM